ncbi:hypothetical protein [Caenispirillum bisanense]
MLALTTMMMIAVAAGATALWTAERQSRHQARARVPVRISRQRRR